MNEQIKLLVKQAGNGGNYNIPPEFIEKYTQILVNECIGRLSKGLQDICLTTFDNGLKDALLERQMKNINEYFGITYKGVAPKQHI